MYHGTGGWRGAGVKHFRKNSRFTYAGGAKPLYSKSTMPIPTEPIGSIPRPLHFIEAIAGGGADAPWLEALYLGAIRDTVFARIRARVRGTALAERVLKGLDAHG